MRTADMSGLARCVLVALMVATIGCARKPQMRGEGVEVQAAQTYLDGLVALQSGDYSEALRHFQTVATSPRYLRFTSLAALRAADTLFYQGFYPQAIDAYRGFLKQFAGNPNVPYAEARIVLAHYRRIPGDWFFMPPAYERELTSVRSAYEAAERFLARYPRHRFAPQVREVRDFCADRLFGHEMYAARFYEKRKKPRGVALRLEAAMQRFPKRAKTEENLFRLARAYSRSEDREGLESALDRYLAVVPDGRRRQRIENWLAELPAVEKQEQESVIEGLDWQGIAE